MDFVGVVMAKHVVKTSLRKIEDGLQEITRLASPEQLKACKVEFDKLMAKQPQLSKDANDSHHVGPVVPGERPSQQAAPEASPGQQPTSSESEPAARAKAKGTLFDAPIDGSVSSSRTKAADVDFDRFWKVFPRRVNKAKAREAFDRAFKKLRAKLSAEECVRTIVDGAKVYAERANPEMLCHPTTWLNGGRWDDDPDGIWAGERPKGSAGVTLGKMTKEMAQMSYEEQLRQARGY